MRQSVMETNQEIRKYLNDYKDGKIVMGKGIDCAPLDDVLRFKEGQVNIINGLDNVGKTAWIFWYYLCLSAKHNLRWKVWSGENKPGMLVRQMIEMYAGRKLKDMTLSEVYRYENQICYWFDFISNDKSYTSAELFKRFADSDADGCLIDPFTGMKRKYSHDANYEFLNETREFTNMTNKTVYINTHPATHGGRRAHEQGHDFAGYACPPGKADTEGGQPFCNRPDDIMTIHRYVGHPQMGFMTLLYTRKIKDTETGGRVVAIDDPIAFDWNYGLGFSCGPHNPLKQYR